MSKPSNSLITRRHSIRVLAAQMPTFKATYLDGLLDRLTRIESLEILPAGRAFEKYVASA